MSNFECRYQHGKRNGRMRKPQTLIGVTLELLSRRAAAPNNGICMFCVHSHRLFSLLFISSYSFRFQKCDRKDEKLCSFFRLLRCFARVNFVLNQKFLLFKYNLPDNRKLYMDEKSLRYDAIMPIKYTFVFVLIYIYIYTLLPPHQFYHVLFYIFCIFHTGQHLP